MNPFRVTSLQVYPVKSLGGQPVQEARVGPKGLAHDRRFMFVDGTGRFLTQRELPRMALVQARAEEGGLLLEAPDMPLLKVPWPTDGTPRSVTVWKDTCEAWEGGEAPSRWLSTFLGREGTLVFMPEAYARKIDATEAGPHAQVSFADAYPLLLISQASLDALNARLKTPVSMKRFRPNIVVEGCAPFEEDTFGRFRIGDVFFRAVKPCKRCVMVCNDPETAVRGKEPLATLATFRAPNGHVLFGQNVVPEGGGVLRVGDAVALE